MTIPEIRKKTGANIKFFLNALWSLFPLVNGSLLCKVTMFSMTHPKVTRQTYDTNYAKGSH